MPRLRPTTFLTTLLFLLLLPSAQGQKPPVTLDEFVDAVDIRSVQISPDGHAVVIETSRADWTGQRFRNDLWLYRDEGGGSLVELTQSGHDSSPQWSPDGRWIAFLSDRKTASGETKVSDQAGRDQVEKNVARVYVISPYGGEAFPVTSGDEELHAFAWSEDSRRVYFATRSPWTKAQKNGDTEEWKDVVRFREAERGDTLFSVDVASLVADNQTYIGQGVQMTAPEKLATQPYRVSQMAVSPDGAFLAMAAGSPYGIYVADLPVGTVHLAIRTMDIVHDIQWAQDNRHVFFMYWEGAPEGPYQEVQGRLYWVDAAGGRAVRWASHFTGEVGTVSATADFAVTQNGAVFAPGWLGTEVQPYTQSSAEAEFVRHSAWPGTYATVSAARHSPRVAFVFSSLQRPREVYLAESPERLQQAKPITAFNRLFMERELPQGKTYRWTADDGTPLEGMLIYPPGKFEARQLPMLTLIHHSWSEADGNDFESDRRQPAALAATQGWLVFEPNYRGSTGYGDAFLLGSRPHFLPRAGKDILEGVDALVKDGIADPDQLTVGGFVYGGDLTNWLITQTTRFRAAVTGASGVEWVVRWGNGASFVGFLIGGVPWEKEANYNAEAAIWRIEKVTTPTLIVGVPEDPRAYGAEAYLLESALQARGVPHRLLIFPGEGHRLDKNPWHGKIKVREELKWLEKYGRKK